MSCPAGGSGARHDRARDVVTRHVDVGEIPYGHIACCLDGSHASLAALEVAAELCALGGGRLRIVHAVRAGGGTPRQITADADGSTPANGRRRRGWGILREAMRRVRAEPVLLEGSHPGSAVRWWAERDRVDLIVVAAHRGQVGRAVLGSFAGYLARHATCSVMVVRPVEAGARDDADRARHVACFVDGSAASQAAIAEAHALASAVSADLSIVHVSPIPFALPLAWQVLPRDECSSGAHSWLISRAGSYPGAEPVVVEGFGPAASLACDWAEHARVDLMVAAAHSGRAARLAMGSFTRYLTHHASSSVLVARPQAAQP